MINEIKKHYKSYLATLLISLGIGAGIFCLYFFLNRQDIVSACSGAALASVIITSAGVLAWLNRMGAFDTFAYGFKQMGSSIFSKNPQKYNNMADYKSEKYKQRKIKSYYHTCILIAGAMLIIATIVLEIIYHTSN